MKRNDLQMEHIIDIETSTLSVEKRQLIQSIDRNDKHYYWNISKNEKEFINRLYQYANIQEDSTR